MPPLLRSLIEHGVFFPETVAGDALEVTVEVVAGTLAAGQGRHFPVLFVGMAAFALGPPLVHIELFPPGQPVHAALFRTGGDEPEGLALAV